MSGFPSLLASAMGARPIGSSSGRMSHPGNPIVPISRKQNLNLIKTAGDIKASRFDLQFTTDENRELWALSDLTSVDAAANFMVRRTLRMRCRYVYHNNPYAQGAARRLANFVIGTGPTLHLETGNEENDKKAEKSFNKWADRVGMGRKFRVSRAARFYNGEGFNLLRTNPRVRHKVKLDLFEIEADQVSSPLFGIFPSQYPDQQFDGLMLDPFGNREVYHVLRQHPGAFGAFLVMGSEFDPWPAEYVLHDYARMRPAQQRGIPEMAPAAQLFEERRRFRASVNAAAETASNYAGFAHTMGPDQEADEAETGFGAEMDYVNIRRRTIGVLPRGYDVSQMKAEQPTTTYPEFDRQLLMEMSQVLDMPLFILTGDAAEVNMSSAYVVSQSFMVGVLSDRQEYDMLADQALEEWIPEAKACGEIPDDYPDDPDHSWRWPRMIRHGDPVKISTAQNMDIKNGVSCPSLIWAENGGDFEEMAQRAAKDFDVPVKNYKQALFQSVFAEKGQPPPASEEDDDELKPKPKPQRPAASAEQ